jgi:hypothetical protein
LFIGGRPALRTALAASPRVEPVTDPAEAACALVDVASLTPTAHAEACRYPLPPSLPLVVVSAIGAERSTDANPYLAEVARAESTATRARADHCVLRCAPMDVDLVQVARQISDFSTVYGCFTDGPVPWLALDDLVDVVALLAAEPARRGGRVYELTGHETASLTRVVGRLASALNVRAEYHPLEADQLVTALCSSVGWDLDMALRVPGHQQWAGAGHPTSPLVGKALHRPPRPLDACITYAVAAVTGPRDDDRPTSTTKGNRS